MLYRTCVWLSVGFVMAACVGTKPAPGSPHVVAPGPTVTAPAPPKDDDWEVTTFAKFSNGAPISVEHWAKLEHAWTDPCGPGKVVAQRRLCLPRGDYVVESLSTEHVDVSIDGRSVIGPRIEFARTIEPSLVELSPPVAIDGCVLARAVMLGEGCYPKSRIRVTVREARKTPPCDERYATGEWNACIFAGRRQEELLGAAVWKDLVSPWPNGGPAGWEDNFSVEARTTACFEPGKYVFHAKVPPGRLNLFLDDGAITYAEAATPRDAATSDPRQLEGCHKLRATYSARDRITAFEVRWAKVGSALAQRWATEALACDPACEAGATCVSATPFGFDQKGARICLPRGRPGNIGEACSPTQPCGRGQLACCRPGGGCNAGAGFCRYIDR